MIMIIFGFKSAKYLILLINITINDYYLRVIIGSTMCLRIDIFIYLFYVVCNIIYF